MNNNKNKLNNKIIFFKKKNIRHTIINGWRELPFNGIHPSILHWSSKNGFNEVGEQQDESLHQRRLEESTSLVCIV